MMKLFIKHGLKTTSKGERMPSAGGLSNKKIYMLLFMEDTIIDMAPGIDMVPDMVPDIDMVPGIAHKTFPTAGYANIVQSLSIINISDKTYFS